MLSYRKILNLIFLVVSLAFYCQTKMINVKDFGAIPDGKTDNSAAFSKAIKKALAYNSSEVLIPYGNYLITEPIRIIYDDKKFSIKGEKNSAGKNPQLKSDKTMDMIFVSGSLNEVSKGSFTVSNLDILGYNIPYSSKHSFAHKPKWFSGINIQNKSFAMIDSVNVSNIYGIGIIVANTKRVDIPVSACFENVEIKNCRILNCWGYNADEYGDGLYISNVQKASVVNNFIFNNTKETKKLGRCGIVIEYMAQNVNLQRNTVEGGYDRALHIEASFGGHLIKNNTFNGSDVGVLISESYKNYSKTKVERNTFSNKNFFQENEKDILFAKHITSERSFIVINTSNLTEEIEIDSNRFVFHKDRPFSGKGIINSNATSAIYRNNFSSGKKIPFFYNQKYKSSQNNKAH